MRSNMMYYQPNGTFCFQAQEGATPYKHGTTSVPIQHFLYSVELITLSIPAKRYPEIATCPILFQFHLHITNLDKIFWYDLQQFAFPK